MLEYLYVDFYQDLVGLYGGINIFCN